MTMLGSNGSSVRYACQEGLNLADPDTQSPATWYQARPWSTPYTISGFGGLGI